jgi:HEAT repeat protein
VLVLLGGIGGWLLSQREHATPTAGTVANAGTPPTTPPQQPTTEPEKPPPPPKSEPRDDLAAERRRAEKNLGEIAVALMKYEEVNQRFPPAVVYSPQGQPLYSWRVLLLPFLDEGELHKQFKLDEAWDSPHNKPLVAKMPAVFAPVRGNKEPGTTRYQVFVGAETAFEGLPPGLPPGVKVPPGVQFPAPRGRGIAQISDGTSNTFLVIEAAEAVPWSKPADLPYSAEKPLPRLGGTFPDGFHAAFADGQVFFIPRTLDGKTIRGFITANAGDDVSRDGILPEPPRPEKKPAGAGKPDDGAKAPVKGDGTAAELARAITDPDGRVRQEAVKELRGLGAAVAVPALLNASRDANVFAWGEIRRTLGEFGPEAKPALLAGLEADDYEVRATAADVLSELSRREVAEPGVMPSWPEVLVERQKRLQTAAGLDRTSPLALEGTLTLLEALHEKEEPQDNGFFHRTVTAALVRMGPIARVAFPDLLYPRWPQDAFVRVHHGDEGAAAGLARESPQAIPAVVEILTPRNPDGGSGQLLASLGPRVVPTLVALLERPGGPHAAVAEALAELGPAARSAVPALTAALKERAPTVRSLAARALGNIGPDAAEALPALSRLLQESNEEARRAAAEPEPPFGRILAGPAAPFEWCRLEAARALVRIDPKQRTAALPALKIALKSHDPFLAADAALVLADLEPTDEVLETLLRRYATPGMDPLGGAFGRETDTILARVGQLSAAGRKALVPVAEAWLRSPDDLRRRVAALALVRIDPEKALAGLRDMVKTGNQKEVAVAAHLLEEMAAKARPAVPDLCEALRTKKADRSGWGVGFESSAVAVALARIDPERAVPFLLEMWRGDRPQPPVKGPDSKDIPRLPAGADSNPFRDLAASMVRQQAVDGLMALGPKAAAVISSSITDLKSADSWISGLAGELLAKIGPAAVRPLVEVARDGQGDARIRAVRALGWIGAEARPALPALLKLAEDEKPTVRQEAVTALGHIDPRDRTTAAALTRAAQDRDALVRRQAVRALGGIGADAIPALEAALGDADAVVRRGAAGALGRIGAPATSALRAALRHKDADVRRLAVLGLGAIGSRNEGVVAALVEAAADRDRLVRRLALSLMDRPGREVRAVVPVLAAALRDPDEQVRWTAAFVLEELGADAADAVEALATTLRDPAVQVRRRAVCALRDIGTAARPALPALQKLLEAPDPHRVRTAEDEALTAAVVEAVLRLDPDPAATFAEAMKVRETAITAAAAQGLVQLGPKAVPTLLKLTRERNLDARLRAIHCLGTIGRPVETVVPALEEFLKDSNDLLRSAAAHALGDIGPAAKDAVARLRPLADDANELVRDAARQALERINR